jgi:hypothetical protein
MQTLTKKQITNLLLNAYGFVDKHGELFTTDKSLLARNEFELRTKKGSIVQFGYDDANFSEGTVTFETLDGDRESFTVVIVAVGGLSFP